MNFQRFTLKKRRSARNLDTPSPAPNVKLDSHSPRVPTVVLDKPSPPVPQQRMKTKFLSSSRDRDAMADINGNGSLLPKSSTFDSENETAVGEPLIQEFATRSIPKEFKPFTSRTPDTASEEFSIQTAFPASANGLPKNAPLAKNYSRETYVHIPPSSSAQLYKHHHVQDDSQAREQEQSKSHEYDNHKHRGLDDKTGFTYNSTPDSHINSSGGSVKSYETSDSSVFLLPPLQAKNGLEEGERLEPVLEDDPKSFDLVQPNEKERSNFSLEQRTEDMMSREHLEEIFADPTLLMQFTSFLSTHRPKSIPLLIYYLDALKALRAISYANAVAEALEPISGFEFSTHPARPTVNPWVEDKAKQAFDSLARNELPAYVTHTFVRVVSVSIQMRICGTLPPHLREASDGLAEVFCLTDPSRADNPIVFSSEEFHRTTQYGVNYAIGRNCRFLQGPRTNKDSTLRLRTAIKEGREVSEVFLNYRRDGSPFVNLLMVAPLLDSRGVTRYFIGAQVDVSGLCKDCTDLHGLQNMLAKQEIAKEDNAVDKEAKQQPPKTDEFQGLSEMFNVAELDTVRKHGGNMHREKQVDLSEDGNAAKRIERPRLLLKELSNPREGNDVSARVNGKLEGIYQNYLLVRPYPSLRILFSSPALRVPGILQSPFMNRIGGSQRVRDELTAALAEGRGVTAKVRWISGRHTKEEEGRVRWIHCTPLLGQNGSVGVWMIVLVDDESSMAQRKFRTAPPVSTEIGNTGNYLNTSHASIFMNGERVGGSISTAAMERPRTASGDHGSVGDEGDGSLHSFALG